MDIQQDFVTDLKYVYDWNHYLMRIMGIWPEERRWNRPSSYLVLLPFLTMFCFAWCPQTINLAFIIKDMDLVVENLSMGNMSVTISIVKTVAIWLNGKLIKCLLHYYTQRTFKMYSICNALFLQGLKSLINCIANDWDTVETKTERETMMNVARLTRKTIIRCTMMCQTVLVVYLFVRLCSMKYNDTKLLFRAYFPYDITVSPNYELTMIGQIAAATYAAATYVLVDTFVAMLILHICGQLSNLRKNLRKLLSYDRKDLQRRWRKIILKHNYITRFSKTVEDCFNVMLLVQMLGCTIQLCFQSFQAIMSFQEEERQYMIFQLTFLIIYISYVLVQLYIYCYVGEKLRVESTEIANTAYEIEWYNLSPRNARLLIIIMCRARSSPLKITAGKFCCFTTILYCQILKTSISYISVLYATKNK